ncbi:MAG TPA: lipopolysaccharide kinase InaA family protein, partial [Planctomycetaceae bacterium]|nr:lipopolysaccharide kinase InaA family protein [Planctomycetaceae bacterium]
MELETAPLVHSPLAGGPHRVSRAFVRVHSGRTRWLVEADLGGDLLDVESPSGLPLEDWLASGAAEVVKSGPHRAVYRLSLPAGEFYLKHYRIPGPRAALQNVIRPCKAMLEWTAIRRVAECGIPTTRPVAVGRTFAGWRIGDNYLVTRSIAGAEPLQDFVLHALPVLAAARQARLRQEIATGLGRLAGRLHRGRLVHDDFHAGNVLVRLDDDDRVRLWLIDLHAVSRRWWPAPREQRANLASLGHFFTALAGRTDRLRFYRAYWLEREGTTWGRLAAGEDDSPTPRPARPFRAGPLRARFARAAREVETFCRRASDQAFHRDDRKWRRRNRRVRILNAPGRHARGLAELGEDVLRKVCDRPDDVFRAACVRHWIRRDPAGRVAMVTLEGGRASGTCRAAWWPARREAPRSLPGSVPLTRLIRPVRWLSSPRTSTARRAWETGHALLRRRIPVAKPLLFVETLDGEGAGSLLLVEVPRDAVPLDTVLRRHAAVGERHGDSLLRAIQGNLADLVRGLHAAGFEHGGLAASQILIAADRQPV